MALLKALFLDGPLHLEDEVLSVGFLVERLLHDLEFTLFVDADKVSGEVDGLEALIMFFVNLLAHDEGGVTIEEKLVFLVSSAVESQLEALVA